MKTLFLTLATLCICTLPATIAAQTGNAAANNAATESRSQAVGQSSKLKDAQVAALKKMNFLIGDWRGTGHMMTGPNQRVTFDVTETVESKLDGMVLIVEGTGKHKDPVTGKETVGHNAFGVLSFDPVKNNYRFSTFTMQGYSAEITPQVSENKMIWGFQNPQAGGEMRYTITLTDKNTWNEIGEFSRDGGKSYVKVFEMDLQRVQ